MTLEAIPLRYLELCFNLEKYVPGLVDSYLGPVDLRDKIAQAPKMPLAELEQQLSELLQQSQRASPSFQRFTFLSKQIQALHTLAKIQSGAEFSYLQEVSKIYDIQPKKAAEATFESALKELAQLLPGDKPLYERLEIYQKALEIPSQLVLKIFSDALALVRQKTKKLLTMPANENFEISLVSNKPWSGYNWFKGNAFSKIEINIDLPRRIDQVLYLMAHEGYPGHHTDACTKEDRLYKQAGFLESSIHPLYSPQSVIAEGIAVLAVEILFSTEEEFAYMQDVVAPQIGLKNFDFLRLKQINKALGQLRASAGNASILLFQEKRSENEIYEYLRTYGLLDNAYARKRIEFIKKYRGYIFCYHYGYELLKNYWKEKDIQKEFIACLSQQTYPEMFETV